jgi:hypothetical protein
VADPQPHHGMERDPGAVALPVLPGGDVDAAAVAQPDVAVGDPRRGGHLRDHLDPAAAEVGPHAELLVDDRPRRPVRAPGL